MFQKNIPSLLPICQKCGAQCCKYGSPVVSAQEYRQIINYCHRDYFKKLKNSFYLIPENPCPYLTKNNKCSIQPVKPLDCKIYPCGIILKKNTLVSSISQRCPAKFILPNQYTKKAIDLMNRMPTNQKKEMAKYNKVYNFDMQDKNHPFGLEVVLDLYGCDVSLLNKKKLICFFNKICQKINVERYGKPMFWHDDSQIIHLRGTSAVQFITTSNITIHALEILAAVYINIFSCKKFDTQIVKEFCENFFKATKSKIKIVDRK